MNIRLILCFSYFFLSNYIALGQDIVPFQEGNSWGYKSQQNNQIYVQDLSYASPFKQGFGIVRKNEHWGAYNRAMQLIIPIIYDEISSFNNNLVIARKSGDLWLYNHNGQEVGKGPYQDISLLKDNAERIVVADRQGNYGIINTAGKEIIDQKYAAAPENLTGTDLLFLKQKKQQFNAGVLTPDGKEIVPFEYLYINPYGPKYYKCQKLTGEIDFYTVQGERIHEGDAGEVISLDENFVLLQYPNYQELIWQQKRNRHRAEKWTRRDGFFYGEEVTGQTQFYTVDGKSFAKKGLYDVYQYKYGYYQVKPKSNRQGFGLWDEKGRVVLDTIFTSISDWSEKWAVVQTPESPRKLALVDLNSGSIVLDELIKVDLLSCNYVRIFKDGDTLLYSPKLVQVNPAAMSNNSVTYYFLKEEDLAKLNRTYVYKSGGNSLADDAENQEDCFSRSTVMKDFKRIDFINDIYGEKPLKDRLLVQTYENENGFTVYKTGIINFSGKEIVPMKYAVIGSHFDGLITVAANVKLDRGVMRKWGIIDRNGNEIVAPTYENIERIYGNIAIVEHKGLKALLNITTKELVSSGYNYIRQTDQGYFIVHIVDKYGVANAAGQLIIPANYKELGPDMIDGGYFSGQRDGKKYLIDLNGNEFLVE
jgi:hypothetical protein